MKCDTEYSREGKNGFENELGAEGKGGTGD